MIISTQFLTAMQAAKDSKAWVVESSPLQPDVKTDPIRVRFKGHVDNIGTRSREILALDRDAKKYDTFPLGDHGVIVQGNAGKVKIRFKKRIHEEQ